MGNILPPPLPEYRSGIDDLDAAIRLLQTNFASEEPHVRAAFKRMRGQLQKGEEKHLAALIAPEACEFGSHGWNEARAAAMTPKERARYQAEHDHAYGSAQERRTQVYPGRSRSGVSRVSRRKA